MQSIRIKFLLVNLFVMLGISAANNVPSTTSTANIPNISAIPIPSNNEIDDIVSNNTAANSLLIDNNNNILLGGSFLSFQKVSSGLDFMLVRYQNDGSLDTTFNPDGDQPGVVVTSVTDDTNIINSITLDNNNRIVAAGYATSNNTDNVSSTSIAVARYLNDGSLDTTFNPTGTNSGIPGVVTTQVQGVNDIATGVIIDGNNKIVVVGSSATATINSLGSIDVFALRYNEDGSLDTTFNSQGLRSGIPGVITINVSSQNPQDNISGQVNIAKAVTIDNNNNIVLAGRADNGLVVGFLVIRLTENGVLDTSFNPKGLQTGIPGTLVTNINTNTLNALKVDGSEDNITGAGVTITLNNGSTDTNNYNTGAVDLLIDRNNKILVSGITVENTSNISSFALVRYNNDGSLDSTFNPQAIGTIQGIVVKNFSENSNDNEIATSVSLDNNDKIVVTGYTQITLPSETVDPTKELFGKIDFLTARFNSNGSSDTTFNQAFTPGYVLTSIDNGVQATEAVPVALSNAISIDNNNNIVVAGFSTNGSVSDVTTVRYLDTGSLDTSFNAASSSTVPGIVVTNVTNGEVPSSESTTGVTVETDIVSLPKTKVDPLLASEISSLVDHTKVKSLDKSKITPPSLGYEKAAQKVPEVQNEIAKTYKASTNTAKKINSELKLPSPAISIKPERDIQVFVNGKKVGGTVSNSLGMWKYDLSGLSKNAKGPHEISILRKNSGDSYDHIMKKTVNI